MIRIEQILLDIDDEFKKSIPGRIKRKLQDFYMSHVTARIDLEQVKCYYKKKYKGNQKEMENLKKRIKFEIFDEYFEKVIGEELIPVQKLADRFCCEGVLKVCKSIQNKKQRDAENQFKYMQGTCAHYFGSSSGCKYGKECIYPHTCRVEDRLKIIHDSKLYLMKKGMV